MSVSIQEENYLKAIYKLTASGDKREVGVNELAQELGLRPPTVHQMLKKLKEKKRVHFKRYGKISLTESGSIEALKLIRRHRIWETFLCDTLGFAWEEVHDLAEYLEHIPSDKLIERLEKFLQFPKYDPHGEPIPGRNGFLHKSYRKTLMQGMPGKTYFVVAVSDNVPSLLEFMSRYGIRIESKIKYLASLGMDNMARVEWNKEHIVVGPTFLNHVKVICRECKQGKKCRDIIPCI